MISYLVYRHLLKIPLKKRWFQAGLACLILTGSAGVSYGQITNWVSIFNSSADTAPWVHIDGVPNTVSFLAGDAPAGGPSTGCMVLRSTFSPSAQWTVIVINVGHLNVTNCTALELDVKVDPSSAFDTWGSACRGFEVGIKYNSSGYKMTSGVTIDPASANNGWRHIVVPADQLAYSTNWGNINYVMIGP